MYDVRAQLDRLPSSFRAADALQQGLTYKVLDRLVRHGEITRVAKGVFCQVAVAEPVVPRWQRIRDDHLRRADAALCRHPHHALSHLTGAVARGWPVELHPDAAVHLTALHVLPRSRRLDGVVLHHCDSMANDVETVNGWAALTPARTVADCLRTHRPPVSVAIADGAIRAGSTSIEDVRTVLDLQRGWLGRPQAARTLALVDPRRESWLESFSFVTLHDLGIEMPTPQVEVFDENGRFVARVDGMWTAAATVAEADGHGKYLDVDAGAEGPTGLSAARRVVAERDRERALVDQGLEVVRWTRDEIKHRAPDVVRRVELARSRGDLRRFRGRLRVQGVWIPPRSLPDTPIRPNQPSNWGQTG